MNHRRSLRIVSALALLFGPSPARADEIHELIEKGEIDQVKTLLARKPELKQSRDKWKCTPLHTAMRAGNVEIVKYLLDLDVDVNARAYNGFTPLHFAEDPRIIKLLADHKADLEALSAGGTPLQYAALRLLDDDTSDYAKQGRDVAKALVVAGARYDILSAARLGDLDRVKQIVKADPRAARDRGAMRDAARNGHVAIVQLLLDNKGDPDDANFGGMTVLYFALKHPAVVKALIRAGADVRSPLKDKRPLASGLLPGGSTILHEAAKVGVTQTMQLLIEAGAIVDARDPFDVTPLQRAAYNGWPEVVKLLHQHKASVRGEDGVAALRMAVCRVYYAEQKADEVTRYKAVIAYLLKEGVPADLRTAIVLGDVSLVKKLVKQDPPRLEKPTRGTKPVLHLAVGLDHKEIVTALLDAGVPVDGPDDGGSTPLHGAAFWGRAEIAKVLIDRGANVEARTDAGATPLGEAARCGRLAAARVLIAAGADVNARDYEGLTPLGCAEKAGAAMMDLLRTHGAK